MKYIVGFVAGLIFWLGVLYFISAPDEYRVYDCSIAEWDTDISKDIRDECRKRRLSNSITV